MQFLREIKESENKFRSDIQALRGIAVLLVVFYHTEVFDIPAGYLGVDIFFVISGYLITSLVLRQINEESFSFTSFYFRRAKRLLPAAFVVLFFSIILAPFFINEIDLEELRAQVIGAITFTTNIVLWDQSGYFDNSADKKVLLHFWSLAIEEQYYILLPAFLFFIHRKYTLIILASIAIFSLISCLTINDQSAGFYLLPFRAWELTIGSIGALASIQKTSNVTSNILKTLALAAIIYIPFYPIGGRIPGVDALIICGATLILIIYKSNSPIATLNPFKLLSWVGNFSYSLYLTHWPIIVFTKAAWLGSPPDSMMWLAVLLAFTSAYLLYMSIELPFHKARIQTKKRFAYILIILSILIISLPYLISTTNKYDIDFAELRHANYGVGKECVSDKKNPFSIIPDACKTKENPKILIWGDSYAMAWASALIEPLLESGLEQATMSACDPLEKMARYPKVEHKKYNLNYAQSCLEFNEAVLNYIKQNNDLEIVIISGRFGSILNGKSNMMLVKEKDAYTHVETSIPLAASGVARAINSIRASGKKVVILAPPPANGMNIGDCLERKSLGKITFGNTSCELPIESVYRLRTLTNEMLNTTSKIANIEIVDIYDFLCNQFICKTEIEGIHLYRDGGHLSVNGAKIIGRKSDIASRVLESAK